MSTFSDCRRMSGTQPYSAICEDEGASRIARGEEPMEVGFVIVAKKLD